MTQKRIILNYLKDRNEWVPSYDLIKVNTPYGWLGSSADREARRLVEDGVIERKRENKYAYYRTLTNQSKETNINERTDRLFKF